MATAKQRQRRLDRRHKHQSKTYTPPGMHAAVQAGGITHIFPNEEVAKEAFTEAVKFSREVLELCKADALRGQAADLNIKGRSKMTKPQLIDAIMEAQS